ncbi:AAA family ATPase [Methanimicrococcus sp. OttesenSCG-928-J09]|nr:AAA family ATPase [Methanimicrococcus sp. OttesenSCG-928-J09]
MKFKHLHVENIRSYEKLDLDFIDGVTVISGVNGSGKSSILEACFMAIFGGDVLKGTPLLIPDMMRKGSTKAVIALDFEHAGDDYKIEQHYRANKTGANTYKSILHKNGEIIAEQAKNTYDAILQLLNMDEKNFQNCAYIRQGDIDALINAKPKDRQQMIDDLLRLGKLEEYRERAHNSKTAVSRVLRSESEKKEIVQAKIAQQRDKNLHAELNKRMEFVEKAKAAALKQNEEKERLTKELTLVESKIAEAEKERAEIENLKKESAELEKKYDSEIVGRENLLQEILGKEKDAAQLLELSKQLRIEINQFKTNSDISQLESLISSSLHSVHINDDSSNIESVSAVIREAETAATAKKHSISSQAEVLGVTKNNIVKDISAKEKESETSKAGLAETISQIEKQILKIDQANAAVEAGFTKAGVEKAAFLSLFDELYAEVQKDAASEIPIGEARAGKEAQEDNDKECISGICDISFYSNVVKIEELPLPSDESAWKMIISDIEKLEEYINSKIHSEENRVTEEEKKKASISGELEEKEKSIAETEKDIRRLDEEKEKTMLELKAEQAEFEKKKQRVSDYAALLEMNGVKRNDKIKTAAVLKETVPDSRYRLNDILPEDITAASDVLSKQKEALVSESAGLKSRDSEIQKAILKKEELLKAGKCPTCGCEIKADDAHPEHGTDEETQQRAEIEKRLADVGKLIADVDSQIAVLKEISVIDETVGAIKSEMNTFRAEEKGKSDLIEKLKKDLEDIDKQKTDLNARKVEHSVFCEARRKDLEKIEQRLADFKAAGARRQEKLRLLSEREKEFSETANSILLTYKTLESEKKMNAESQKRVTEFEKSKDEADKNLQALKIELEKMTAAEIKIREEEKQAVSALNLIAVLRKKTEQLSDFAAQLEMLKAIMEGLKKTMVELDKTVDNYKTQIAGKSVKIKELNEKIEAALGSNAGGLSASDQKKILSGQIQLIAEKIADWDGKMAELLQQIGTYRTELAMLAENEKEAELLRNKIHFLSHVSADVSALEEMYLRIRSEMRTKNIEALDRLLNEMFDFIYSNNAYSHLELDSDYNLKVHEKDGSVLEPKQLSGGERAIFNLALRCAIYRLLSLGFGENNSGKTSLPPLIFDEPTVFLDSGHVRQLIVLIEHMRDDGVGQIIVVSHDESLIDSADMNYRVEKDPLTNASSVF